MKRRLNPTDRREQILQASIDLATKCGVEGLRMDDIAAKAETSRALVAHYFGTMIGLKRDVWRAAISRSVVPIVARGIATGNKAVRKAPPELRAKAAEYLAQQAA